MKAYFPVALCIVALAHWGAGASVGDSDEYPPEVTVIKVPGKTRSDVGKVYLVYNKAVSWMQATQECLNFGAQLVRINNAVEQEDFSRHVLSRPDVTTDLWVNGRQTPAGTYQFLNLGALPTPVNYNNFYPSCPTGGQGNCIAVFSFYEFYWPTYWFPDPCTNLRPIACEKV